MTGAEKRNQEEKTLAVSDIQENPNFCRRSIIVIHGVGNPAPGEVLRQISGCFEEGMEGSCRREDLVWHGVEYPRLKIAHSQFEEIIEINWSDIRQPRNTSIGVIRHAFLLLIAMLMVATQKRGPGRRVFPFAMTYRRAFETFLIWSIWCPVLAMLVVTTPDSVIRWSLAPIVLFVGGALAIYLRGLSRAYVFGMIWTVAYTTMIVLVALEQPANFVEYWSEISAAVYLFSQVLSVILLVAASVEVAIRERHRTRDQRLAAIGFLYIPFVGISAIGTIIWSVALTFGHKGANYATWTESFLRTIRYDLESVEWVTGGGVVVILLFTLAIAGRYYLNAKKNSPLVPSGRLARDGVGRLLRLAPLILSLVGAYFFISLVGGFVLSDSGDPFDVYRISALRLIPFVPFLVGPLAIVLDVAGDVVFYLFPDNGWLSIRSQTRERLRRILARLRAGSAREIVVVAHSQGSVIAFDEFSHDTRLEGQLVTMGSPIDSLYKRFLGWDPSVKDVEARRVLNWLNIHGLADWVGGPIGEATRNAERPEGGHTNYWRDTAVWKIIMRWLDNSGRG